MNRAIISAAAFGMLWSASHAHGQTLPKYSDIIKDTLQLRNESFSAKTRAFDAISKSNPSIFSSFCKQMQDENSAFVAQFYSNKSYAYFLDKNPTSYKEHYLRGSILALTDAMGVRLQAIYIGCSAQSLDRSTLISVLSLLSTSYTGTQTVELWAELADAAK